MTAETFEQIVEARLEVLRSTLLAKAEEYASEDRLHNFKRSAAITGETPEQICIGFFVKHMTSLLDIVEDLSSGRTESKRVTVYEEKVTDALNYLLLLEALIKERLT